MFPGRADEKYLFAETKEEKVELKKDYQNHKLTN